MPPNPNELIPARRPVLERFRGLVRADIRAFERFTAPPTPLRSPLLAVGGLEDPLCRAEHMFDWRDHAARTFVDFLAGGHFFMQSNAGAYAACIQRFLAGLDVPGGRGHGAR